MEAVAEYLNFDVDTAKRFKAAYLEAVKQKVNTFEFERKGFLVDYAKYLVEYLESQLGDLS